MTAPDGPVTLPVRSRWRHPVVGRSAWTLADQALSSASNFVLAVSVLAVAERRQFAAFSVVITGYLLVTQLTRSAFSIPVLLLYSDADVAGDGAGAGAGRRSGPAAAASVAVGVVGAVVFAIAGVGFEAGRTLFLVAAAALPFLQYQDAVRHVAVAGAVPKVAAQSDGLWVALQIGGTLAAAVAGRATPLVLVAVWAVAGSVAGLVFGARLGLVPAFSGIGGWLREHRPLCVRLASEFVLNSGSYYALSYGLVVVAGSDQLGRWRAAQTLIGPVSVLLLGGSTLGVPESVRVRDREARLRQFAILLSAVLAAVSVVGGVLAYALLPGFGPDLFPDTWASARPVLPVLTVFAAAVGASTGAVAALRARGQTGWIVRGRGVSGGVGLVLGLALAPAWGATGALTGLAVSECGFGLAAWLRVRRTLAGPMAPPMAPPMLLT